MPEGPEMDFEEGRTRREAPGIAGLAGRGMPLVERPEGEAGRPIPDVSLVVCAGGIEDAVADFGVGGVLGPATRRRRSSSCVLSFGVRGPTRDQIFSPSTV
jgi:hypothetical protein